MARPLSGGYSHGAPAASCTSRRSLSAPVGSLRRWTQPRVRQGASSAVQTCWPATGDPRRCHDTARWATLLHAEHIRCISA